MFLNFINFFKRFIFQYFKIVASLIDLLKDNKNEKKAKSFEWSKTTQLTFRALRDIFTSTSFLIHYDSIKLIRVKIDVSNFAIVDILNQQNVNDHWRSMTFWSRKINSIKQNYETHNQKLLIIMNLFKQWKHYLKNNSYFIEV